MTNNLDVYGQIEQYSQLGFALDQLELEKKALKDQVIPQELKDKLAEIDAEYADKSASLSEQRGIYEEAIKQAVLAAGKTIKGNHHSFVFTKGRVTWDGKKLDGMMSIIPALRDARREGDPSVSVRKV